MYNREKFINENLNIDMSSEDLDQILRLKKLINKYSDKNTIKIENDFFKKYGCNDEFDKIVLECNYVRKKLIDKKDEYENVSNFEEDLEIIDFIKDNIDKISRDDKDRIKKVKQVLVLIELDLDIGINFVSEIKDIYDVKLYKLDENSNKKVK